jgi:hypothetical protein
MDNSIKATSDRIEAYIDSRYTETTGGQVKTKLTQPDLKSDMFYTT